MDPIDLAGRSRLEGDPLDHDLAEVDAAIALVERGVARRISLVSLRFAERVIGIAVARGQDAGILVRPIRDLGEGITAIEFLAVPR